MRTLVVLAFLGLVLGFGHWLSQRPPAWLSADPLLHPLGRELAAESTSEKSAETDGKVVDFPLAVNDADASDFEALPGIGPVLAERIVADRTATGPFQRPEDLLRVKGIGEKTLARMLPLLRFEPASSDSVSAP